MERAYNFSTNFLLLSALVLTASGFAVSAENSSRQCQSDRVVLQMLGTHGPEMITGDDQASTGYLIRLDGKARVIVDAGPGSLQRFKQSGADFNDVDLMLFSHFHVDHSADFPAYIKAAFFSQRSNNLYVYGPEGSDFIASTEQFVERAIGSDAGLFPYLGDVANQGAQSSYKIISKSIPWSISDLSVREVHDKNGFKAQAVPTHHGPFPSVSYRVDIAGCSLGFTGDMTGRLGVVPDLVRDVDILVAHFAISEDATGIAVNLHMKPSYIGQLAEKANAGKLLLTHLMKRSLAVADESVSIIQEYYKGEVVMPSDLEPFNP